MTEATIIASPMLDNSMSYDHRDALVFIFETPDGARHTGVYRFDPEMQPSLSFQAGDTVTLHGQTDQYDTLNLSHFEYEQHP